MTRTLAPNHESPRQRLVDVVFGVPTPERRQRSLLAVVIAVGAHGSLWLWAQGSERSLESWSAELAVRVHAELSRDELVELTKPPAPPPPVKEQEAEAPPTQVRARAAIRPSTAGPSRPPPPAQAGAIIAQDPSPNTPLDLTGETFVTGTASAYAGGVTASNGTNAVAVYTRVPTREVDPQSPPRAHPEEPDRSSKVALEDQAWSCPWPREADAEQIDEQTVVIRVVVRADGSVESTSVVSDPGHGFGPAAAACAMRTRFAPAQDRHGRAIRSSSPPIRVRFTR